MLYEATEKKVAAFADAHNPKLSPDRKLATCFESFIGNEPLTFEPLIMSHLHFSGVAVCDDFDVPDLMMTASGLACLSAPSKARGLSVTILSGNLNAWKAAVTSGILRESTHSLALQILNAFTVEGYSTVFNGSDRRMISK